MLTGSPKRKILTFVDYQLLQLPLGGSSLHYLLVNSICRHKTINHHGLCLANSVTPVLGLQVRLGVLSRERNKLATPLTFCKRCTTDSIFNSKLRESEQKQ